MDLFGVEFYLSANGFFYHFEEILTFWEEWVLPKVFCTLCSKRSFTEVLEEGLGSRGDNLFTFMYLVFIL